MVATARDLDAGFVHLNYRLVTARRMKELSAAGLKVMVYTVNSLEAARRLLEMGGWGLFTDFPDVALRVLQDGDTPEDS